MTSSPLHVAHRVCQAVSAWCRRRPVLFTIGVLLIALVRWGANIGPAFAHTFRDAARVFPDPGGWLDSSVGVVLVMRALRYPSDTGWVLWGLVTFVVMAALVVVWTRRAGPWRLEALLVVVLSPGFGVLTQVMGHYDYFTLIGCALAASARRRAWIAAAGVVAVLGNPEQVLVGAVCLGAVSVAYPRLRRNAVILGAVAVAWLLALQVIHGAVSARFASADDPIFLSTGVRRFLADWPLAIWAFLGPLWVVVLVAVSLLRGRDKVAVLAGVVVVPAVVSVVTIDGTRVFVAVSCAALVGLVQETWRAHWAAEPPPAALLGVLVAALFVTPPVNLFPGAPGLLVQPYDFLLSRYVHWGLTPEKFAQPR